MDDEQEFLPDELDALIEDLQKGSSIDVPHTQQATTDFLHNLINTTHATALDATFETRLDRRLKKNAAILLPHGVRQIDMALAHPVHQWRNLALAITSVTLVSVLAISSMINPHTPSADLTPVIAYATQENLAPEGLSTLSARTIAALPATRSKTTAGTAVLQVIQAPEPPHTPSPMQTDSDEPSIHH
jgi:hypothetical protein